MMQDQMFGMYDYNYQTVAKYASNEDDAMDLGTKSEGNNEAMDTNLDNNTEDNNNNNLVQPNNDIQSNFQLYVVNAQQFLPLQERIDLQYAFYIDYARQRLQWTCMNPS
jgi:hypothetical protein